MYLCAHTFSSLTGTGSLPLRPWVSQTRLPWAPPCRRTNTHLSAVSSDNTYWISSWKYLLLYTLTMSAHSLLPSAWLSLVPHPLYSMFTNSQSSGKQHLYIQLNVCCAQGVRSHKSILVRLIWRKPCIKNCHGPKILADIQEETYVHNANITDSGSLNFLHLFM